jgi:hypothetical protein
LCNLLTPTTAKGIGVNKTKCAHQNEKTGKLYYNLKHSGPIICLTKEVSNIYLSNRYKGINVTIDPVALSTNAHVPKQLRRTSQRVFV